MRIDVWEDQKQVKVYNIHFIYIYPTCGTLYLPNIDTGIKDSQNDVSSVWLIDQISIQTHIL